MELSTKVGDQLDTYDEILLKNKNKKKFQFTAC